VIATVGLTRVNAVGPGWVDTPMDQVRGDRSRDGTIRTVAVALPGADA